MNEFDQLQIDDSFIRAITFQPSKIVRISVLRAPASDVERQVVMQYDLHFRGVRLCGFNFDAEPWLEIKSHEILSSSDYLKHLVAQAEDNQDPKTHAELFHFRLTLDEGQIDIIAESFTGSIVEETPYYGHFHPEPEEDEPNEQSVSGSYHKDELSCSFCGKLRSEVSKIITASTANICDECVATCCEIISASDEDAN